MTEKLKALYLKYREVISYLVFGVLTTVVNFAVYFIMKRALGINDDSDGKAFLVVAANTVAWVFAVAFAFVTNKIFVFRNGENKGGALIFQILTFVGARLLSFFFESASLFCCVQWLNFNEDIVKLVVAVVVVIINYIASKLIVFRKK